MESQFLRLSVFLHSFKDQAEGLNLDVSTIKEEERFESFKEENMKKAAVLTNDGFEELEMIGPVDLMVRAGADVDLVCPKGQTEVTGRSGMTFDGVKPMEDYDFSDIDLLLLPGGGHFQSLEADPKVKEEILKAYNNPDQIVAAICASPTILGRMGLLKDRDYTCFLSMNEDFGGRFNDQDYAVIDGDLVTGRSAAAAVDFGLAVLKALYGDKKADEIAQSIYYQKN